MKTLALAAVLTALAGLARATEWPPEIDRQLPPGYEVLSRASASLDSAREVEIVALARKDEDSQRKESERAPARPLLIFMRRSGGSFQSVGRNDRIVMRADEGGQCDPFKDGGSVIAVKRRLFTVENGVACGAHWTDYVTFRFDDALGRYVFDNRRSRSWKLNSSNDPGAEALIPVAPEAVRRGDRNRPVLFEDWRP